MEIVVDTNFAITCTRQRIDFFDLASEIIEEQITWVIPNNIIREIKEISMKKETSIKDRQASLLFLEMLEIKLKDKIEIKQIELEGSVVDELLVNYCLKKPERVLATLDRKLKSRISNRILTLKGKKFLRIV